MADAPKLLPKDKLREGYPKINMAIDNANEALKKSYASDSTSTNAINIANEANDLSNSVQNQLNQAVIGGSIDPETKQARVEKDGTVHETLKAHTDSIHVKIDSLINVKDYVGYGEIILPDDFVPKLPFSLYRDRDGLIKHNYNLSQFEQYTKVLYVDSNIGADSNNGDQSTPFKSLKKALQTASSLSETDILIRVKGNQLRGYGGIDSTASAITTITNKRISIISDSSSKIVIANAQSSAEPSGLTLTWTQDSGAWKTSRSNSWNVFDLLNRDVYGVAKPLEYATSVALCQSTPNSWYTDNTNVWVNTYNGRQPDGNILVCINVCNFWVKLVNSTIYMRDLEFYSGFLSDTLKMYGSCFIEGDYTSKVITNKCNFAGGEARDTGTSIPYTNGFQFLNVKECYSFNCVAAYTRRDGFNYHYYTIPAANRRNCLVFEFNCNSYVNGRYDSNGNNNAFTVHEGISVLRVNPIGYQSKGPVCADVNGCYTIIIDGSMRDSLIAANYDAASAYYFDNSGATTPGKAVMVNCEGGSPKYSIYADANFDVQIRNFIGKNVKSDIALSYLK